MIKLSQATMTAREWMEMEDNPIQRNTELQAKKARNKHLKVSSPTHARVSAAQLPDGHQYKLDGHTRSLLWQEGALDAPEILYVDLYHVDNAQQVEDLYKTFDSQDSVEGAIDRMHGAFRLHGFFPKSTLVVNGGITSAIQLLSNNRGSGAARFNIYKQIEPWIDSIQVIDQRGFSNSHFKVGMLAAMILTVRIYGPSALDFWEGYANDEGVKTKDYRCPIEEISRVSKQQTNKDGNKKFTTQHLCERAISCFETWRAGGVYSSTASGSKRTDLRKYVEKRIRQDAA